MLSVIPPSKFEKEELEKFIEKTVKKRGLSGKGLLEGITLKGTVWMPYYKIEYAYSRSREDSIRSYGKTGRGETALNAMFCGCARGESDLAMLFRPNYLKYEMITYSPQSDETIGPTFKVDLGGGLSRVLKRLNKVKDELHELRSTLNKDYVRIRRHSIILPVRGKLKGTETLSKKVGKLNALKNILGMCLDLREDAEAIEVLNNSVFYYPTLVASLKQRKREEAERFLIIDLVRSGLISKTLNLEVVLTRLCTKNGACREVLAKAVAPPS